MSSVNKFNIHWQIVRVDAKAIKDPQSKIDYVMKYLNDNKNKHNYSRVYNWLRMTGFAYKNDDRIMFERAVIALAERSNEFMSDVDNDNDLSKVLASDLLKVHKDLSKRKYDFQYKSAPKDHGGFMVKLEHAIKEILYFKPIVD